jgi:hypothetical protein
VRCQPACRDLSPAAEKRPLLKPLPSNAVKTVTDNSYSVYDLKVE